MAESWAIWDLISRNALWDFETETEALAYIRELTGQGWKPVDLVLIFDDPALADEDLPPGITGDELARRAGLSGSDPIRRTA